MVIAPDGVSIATQRFLGGEFSNGPNWNSRLFAAACDLAGNGVPREKAERLLLAGARPWGEEERDKAIATIESAYGERRVPARAIARQRDGRVAEGFVAGEITVRII